MRALLHTELWPGTGNRETWRRWLQPSHPIRWAWDTWARHRAEMEARLEQPENAHLRVLRLRRPNQIRNVTDWLRE
jgi:hypothetical protein